MKRFISCVLTLVLVLGMIPASMLSALARGRGVYYSDTENQSLINANGQYIPETIKVDGILDDTGWPASGFSYVDKNTGLWNTAEVPEDAIADHLNYRYQIRADYDHLYVGASVTVPEGETDAKFTVMFKDQTGNYFTKKITSNATDGSDGKIIRTEDITGREWWYRYAFKPVDDKENCYTLENKVKGDGVVSGMTCPENGFILALHDESGINTAEIQILWNLMLGTEVQFKQDPTKLAGQAGEIEFSYYQVNTSEEKPFFVTHYNDIVKEGAGVIVTKGDQYQHDTSYRTHVAFVPVDKSRNLYRIVSIVKGVNSSDKVAPLSIPSNGKENGFVWVINEGNDYTNSTTPGPDYTSDQCNNAIADSNNWKVGMLFDFGGFDPTAGKVPTNDANVNWYDDNYYCGASYRIIQDGYTGKLVFNLSGDKVTVDADSLFNVLLTDKAVGENTLPMHWALESKKEGNTYTFEFRNMLLDTFGGQRSLSDISYFVSADIGETSLIHPIAAVDNMDYTVPNFENGAFLAEVPTSEFWPLTAVDDGNGNMSVTDAGGKITTLATGADAPDYAIKVDGIFDEATWVRLTDYFVSEHYGNYEYKEDPGHLTMTGNTDFGTGVFGAMPEAGATVKYKAEFRVDTGYFYGAVVAYTDKECAKLVLDFGNEIRLGVEHTTKKEEVKSVLTGSLADVAEASAFKTGRLFKFELKIPYTHVLNANGDILFGTYVLDSDNGSSWLGKTGTTQKTITEEQISAAKRQPYGDGMNCKDGNISAELFSALVAPDYFIEGTGINGADATGPAHRYAYKLAGDNEFLYGAAVLKARDDSSWSAESVFKLDISRNTAWTEITNSTIYLENLSVDGTCYFSGKTNDVNKAFDGYYPGKADDTTYTENDINNIYGNNAIYNAFKDDEVVYRFDIRSSDMLDKTIKYIIINVGSGEAGITKPEGYKLEYSVDGSKYTELDIKVAQGRETYKKSSSNWVMNDIYLVLEEPISASVAKKLKLTIDSGSQDFLWVSEIGVYGNNPASTSVDHSISMNLFGGRNGAKISDYTDSYYKTVEVNDNVYALEFRIPWSELGIEPSLTPENETDILFKYSVAAGDGAEMLCHPVNANNMTVRTENFSYAQMIDTFVIDGKFEEKAWTENDMIHVDSDEGTWANKSTYNNTADRGVDVAVNTKDPEKPQNNIVFDYDYKLYASNDYLYGAARIDADGIANGTEFNIWINNGIEEFDWLRDTSSTTVPVPYYQPTYRAKNESACYPNKDTVIKAWCDGENCQTDTYTYNGTTVSKSKTTCNKANTHIVEEGSTAGTYSWVKYFKIDTYETEKKYYRNYNYKISLDESGTLTGTATPDLYYPDGNPHNTIRVDKDNFTYAMTTINGITYVEFAIDLANFGCDNTDELKYFVSVSNTYKDEDGKTNETLSLYHPKIPDSNNFWLNDIDRNISTGHSGMGVLFTGNGTSVFKDGTDTAYSNKYTVSTSGYKACTHIVFEPIMKDGQYTGVCKVVDVCKLASIGASYNLTIDQSKKQFAYVVHTGRETSFERIEATWESVFAYFEAMSWNVGDEVMFHGVDIEKIINGTGSFTDNIPALNLYSSTHAGDQTNDNLGYYTTARVVRIKNGAITEGYITGTYIRRSPLEHSWDIKNAGTIAPLVHFAPEVITVDGQLNDAGWANEDLWIDVDHGINASLMNTLKADAVDLKYSFALRTDAEYLYVAAKLNTEFEKGVSFRLWLQGNGAEKTSANGTPAESDEILTYSHLYDLAWGNDSKVKFNSLPEEDYKLAEGVTEKYDSFKYLGNDSIVVEVDTDNNTISYSSDNNEYTLRFAQNGNNIKPDGNSNTLNKYLYEGDSALYGYTEQVQENQTSGEFYPTIETEKIYLGKQAGVIRSVENETYVEFRVKLDEFGGKEGFEYFTQAAKNVTYTENGKTKEDLQQLLYPACYIEPGSSAYFRDDNMPHALWDSNTAAKVTAADMKDGLIKLRNNCMPVVTLGIKINDNYSTVKEDGTVVEGAKAIRFGALYNEDYIRNFVAKDKNPLSDTSDPMYTDEMLDYWDVADVGIIYIPTQLLGTEENKDPNGVTLNHDTNRAQWDSAINIVDWVHNTSDGWSNYADYENFSFYVTIYNMPTNVRFSFRSYVDFYNSTGVETYYGETLVRSFNGVLDKNMPEDEDSGVTVPDTPEPEPEPVPPTVYNISAETGTGDWQLSNITDTFSYSYYYEVIDENFVLSVTVNDEDDLVITPDNQSSGNGQGTNVRLWVNYGAEKWDRLYDGFVKSSGAKIYSKTPSGDASTTGIVDLVGKTFTFTIPLEEISGGNDEFQFIVCVSNTKKAGDNNSNAALYPKYNSLPANDWDEEIAHTIVKKPETTLPIVAYIPLDDRPVNYDRVEYLVGSVDFELLMPNEDLFSTRLSEPSGKVGTATLEDKCGNPEALYSWLKGVVESDAADYYVISLDQILSGGLVNSRAQTYTGNLDFEKGVMDYIIELSKTEKVYVLDTVMRLASTAGYQDYESTIYDILRKNYANIARPTISEADLTVENILDNYPKYANGTAIQTPQGISDELLEKYLSARERKLRIAEYFYNHEDIRYVDKIFIGVDDAEPSPNIQTNEIAFIKKLATARNANYNLFAGTDELGLMCVTLAVKDKYNATVNASVEYFGDGRDWYADDYDNDTLDASLNLHLAGLGVNQVDVSAADKETLRVLVLTRKDSDVNNTEADADQVTALINKANEYLGNKYPVCIIDATHSECKQLDLALLTSNMPLSKLLGYSSWNTVGNGVGIALSNAVSRLIYLTNADVVTDESNHGFLKTITVSFIKDISYKKHDVTNLNDSTTYGFNAFISVINTSEILVKDLDTLNGAAHGTISVVSLTYPWSRNFEARFEFAVN